MEKAFVCMAAMGIAVSVALPAVATSCAPPGSGAGGTQLVASVELSWHEGVNSNAYG